jgi:hypothetical protein
MCVYKLLLELFKKKEYSGMWAYPILQCEPTQFLYRGNLAREGAKHLSMSYLESRLLHCGAMKINGQLNTVLYFDMRSKKVGCRQHKGFPAQVAKALAEFCMVCTKYQPS